MTFLLASLLVSLFPSTTFAQTPTNKGLAISPPQQFLEVDAGKTVQGNVTIANFTTAPLTVTLSVEQFSVADYSYNYIFSDVKENWLHFTQTVVQLQPNKSAQVAYSVTPPGKTAPGGKYYTIVASATLKQGSISSQVQVATPLYITVNGPTIQTNKLVSHSISGFVVGNVIPFSLDINNTGNVHYTATTTGSISGLWTDKSTVTATHILLPGTTRRVTDDIPSPLLPGIYKATYGYSTDSSKPIISEGLVVYTPLWFYAVVILGSWGLSILIRRHTAKKKLSQATDSRQQQYK